MNITLQFFCEAPVLQDFAACNFSATRAFCKKTTGRGSHGRFAEVVCKLLILLVRKYPAEVSCGSAEVFCKLLIYNETGFFAEVTVFLTHGAARVPPPLFSENQSGAAGGRWFR